MQTLPLLAAALEQTLSAHVAAGKLVLTDKQIVERLVALLTVALGG